MKTHHLLSTVLLVLFPVLGATLHPVQVNAQKKPVATKKASAAVKYTCPMHKEVISNRPGKCPKCGMTLVKITSPAAPAAKKPAKK